LFNFFYEKALNDMKSDDNTGDGLPVWDREVILEGTDQSSQTKRNGIIADPGEFHEDHTNIFGSITWQLGVVGG
jgi:hypothetical protein